MIQILLIRFGPLSLITSLLVSCRRLTTHNEMGSTSKSVVDMIEASSKVHYSGFHMNGHISGVEPSAALQGTTDIQRQPFVIGLFCFFF